MKQKVEFMFTRGYKIKVTRQPNGNVYSECVKKNYTDEVPFEICPHPLRAKKEKVLKDVQFLIDSATEMRIQNLKRLKEKRK